nr:MAG TPA: hypothetical protein [Caudoviricetes sp.]
MSALAANHLPVLPKLTPVVDTAKTDCTAIGKEMDLPVS